MPCSIRKYCRKIPNPPLVFCAICLPGPSFFCNVHSISYIYLAARMHFLHLCLVWSFQAGSQVPSFRPYLLALLTHQSSWTTLHQCIKLLLCRNREQRWALFFSGLARSFELSDSLCQERKNRTWEQELPRSTVHLPGDVTQPKPGFVRGMLISVMLIVYLGINIACCLMEAAHKDLAVF